MPRLRVLLIAPFVSRQATGEAHVAFRWAEALAPLVDLTVLAMDSPPHHAPLREQLPGADVTTWPVPRALRRTGRLGAMLKPEWPVFAARVRRHLARNPGRWDVAHQLMPQAPRYATPLRGAGVPYVIGPLGGTLPTPPGFAHEVAPELFSRLRALDGLRLCHDPRLRAGYRDAALVLGVAPYVGARLAAAGIVPRRYENILELGVDGPAGPREPGPDGVVRLLHVGRGVRTKGLRDVIRAMAIADDPRLRLVSAGEGPEIEACRREAERLGLADRVRFLGLVPREAVERLYAQADVFAFPSFREPAGNVLYEAMRWGLPVIGAAAGGPDAILDETCAIKIPVTDPDRFARDIAAALRRLADDPALRERMGRAGQARVLREGLWTAKAERMAALLREVAQVQ
ncbi:glycosyltransferase family 4 protein [Jannaschia sp. W003]|uniref:glycosyltransferase family 4 protein n=1 Tax=Jannaschia sp. W003 TaxID=2867012 RepID=UPI0021A8E17B|nr:glycosyltransferase family 4 protein [Jannaschia sp. W003]UWQ22279.1 glycosyltransferase family 4 protein [Jannaschia sp. W003]